MKLYKLSQDVNTGYDTYDSMVVCAKDAYEAKNIHPYEYPNAWESGVWGNSPDQVTVEYIGEAAEDLAVGVVCASFNAG